MQGTLSTQNCGLFCTDFKFMNFFRCSFTTERSKFLFSGSLHHWLHYYRIDETSTPPAPEVV